MLNVRLAKIIKTSDTLKEHRPIPTWSTVAVQKKIMDPDFKTQLLNAVTVTTTGDPTKYR